jgi:hypothetical protein
MISFTINGREVTHVIGWHQFEGYHQFQIKLTETVDPALLLATIDLDRIELDGQEFRVNHASLSNGVLYILGVFK